MSNMYRSDPAFLINNDLRSQLHDMPRLLSATLLGTSVRKISYTLNFDVRVPFKAIIIGYSYVLDASQI